MNAKVRFSFTGLNRLQTIRHIMKNISFFYNRKDFHLCETLYRYALELMELQEKNAVNNISYISELHEILLIDLCYEIYEAIDNNRELTFQEVSFVLQISLSIIKIIQLHCAEYRDTFDLFYFSTVPLKLFCIMWHLKKNKAEKDSLTESVREYLKFNIISREGDVSPLHLACSPLDMQERLRDTKYEYPSAALVKLLLELGECPNSRNNFGETPLHFIIYTNAPATTKIIELLLQHGADLDVPGYRNDTPLQRLKENYTSYYDLLPKVPNLRCLCARAVDAYRIPYEGKLLPINLKQIIDLHTSMM